MTKHIEDENREHTIEDIYNLTKENNEILKKIHFSQKVNNIFKIVYWVLILVSVFGAYYLLQPILNSTLGGFTSIQNTINSISNETQNLPDVSRVKNAINNFTN